ACRLRADSEIVAENLFTGRRRTPTPNRAPAYRSAAPDAVHQAGLFVESASWYRSLSQYKERWQRNRKAARMRSNRVRGSSSSNFSLLNSLVRYKNQEKLICSADEVVQSEDTFQDKTVR